MSLFVADREITEADIAREMQHHRAADRRMSRREAAQALVIRELLRLEAEQRGLDAQPEGAESREEAAIRQLLDLAVDVATPDVAACRRYYEANREQIRRPDCVRVRHILFAAAPADVNARLAARDEAERVIAELKQHPQRFTEFAQRFSACPSRDEGGELGAVQRGDTTPEFERQVFRLKPGLAGLPVESRYGHHVVQIDAIERGEPLSFDEALPMLAERIELQLRQQSLQGFVADLFSRFDVRGLDELDADQAATSARSA